MEVRHPLLDREREVRAIDEALTAAAQGRGGALAIRGGLGTGKTALLAAAGHRGRSLGFTVLAAHSAFLERTSPFRTACRMFDYRVRHAADPGLDALYAHVLRAAGLSTGDPDDRTPQVAMHALDQLLTRLSGGAPALVLVDDVQWADRPSLRWLATLCEQAAHAPVLVLAAAGDGEPPTDRALLDELHAAATRSLHPAALGQPAAAALFTHHLGTAAEPAFVAACVELTGGNPLLLRTFAKTLIEHAVPPVAERVGALGELVAVALGTAIRVRLRRVSPHALDIVQAVAVLDAEATVDRVAEVFGLNEAEVAETTVELARMGLLTGTGSSLRFALPLLRTMVLGDLPPTTSQAINTHSALLLHASGAPAGRVAEHVVAGGPIAERWVPAVLREAARDALRDGSPERAVRYLRHALDVPLTGHSRITAALELGEAEARVDVAAAIARLTGALDGHDVTAIGADPPPDDAPECSMRHGSAVRQLAGLLALTGRDDAALELLQAHADRVADHELILAELRLRRAATAPAALELIDRHARTAPPSQPDNARLLSLLAAREAWGAGSRDTATALAGRALATFPSEPDDAAAALRAILVLAHAGAVAEADARCEALYDAAARWRHLPLLARVHGVRSYLAHRLGRLAVALDEARRGCRLLDESGAGPTAATGLGLHARLTDALIDLGRGDEAVAALERAGLTGDVPDTWCGAALLQSRGRLWTATGHPADGVRDLLNCGRLLGHWRVDNPAVSPWRLHAALALHAMDAVDEARRHIEAAMVPARRWAAPGPFAEALRVQAVVTGGRRVVEFLATSVSTAEGSGEPLELARCLVEYGTSLNRTRRRRQARQALHAGLDLAYGCGAATLVDLARGQLTASGARRLSPRTGPASLTPAERRVAQFAAAGRTNRQIAELLFVQQRTVELHLTNVYRKLGIDRRYELAAALSAEDTAADEPPT